MKTYERRYGRTREKNNRYDVLMSFPAASLNDQNNRVAITTLL